MIAELGERVVRHGHDALARIAVERAERTARQGITMIGCADVERGILDESMLEQLARLLENGSNLAE